MGHISALTDKKDSYDARWTDELYARQARGNDVRFIFGNVVCAEDESFRVVNDDGNEMIAYRAEACLIEPDVLDRVLVSLNESGESYILSVLVKHGSSSRLLLPDGAKIHSNDSLSLEAEEICISAKRNAVIGAPEISLTGASGIFNFASSFFSCISLTAKIKKVSAMMETINTVVDRITQRARNIFRQVENLEQVNAGRISSTAKNGYLIRSGHISVKSKEEVEIDGKKIHLG